MIIRDNLSSGSVVDSMPDLDVRGMLAELVDMITDAEKQDDEIMADLRARVWREIDYYAQSEIDDGGA